jgi:hypothetical protein
MIESWKLVTDSAIDALFGAVKGLLEDAWALARTLFGESEIMKNAVGHNPRKSAEDTREARTAKIVRKNDGGFLVLDGWDLGPL